MKTEPPSPGAEEGRKIEGTKIEERFDRHGCADELPVLRLQDGGALGRRGRRALLGLTTLQLQRELASRRAVARPDLKCRIGSFLDDYSMPFFSVVSRVASSCH